jgi:2-polyprenyl-6-methoxyphenol hydroxylase-like FAD-dependent oxidoreductase
MRREAFDKVLLDAARGAGAEVREGSARHRPGRRGRPGGRGDLPERRRPETVRARLVIGADGRRSVVARRLGLLREHRSLRKFAVRGYWDGMEGLEALGEMHVGGGGYCGIAPLSPRRANVTFVLDRREMAAGGRGPRGVLPAGAAPLAAPAGAASRMPRSSALRARSGPWPWRRARLGARRAPRGRLGRVLRSLHR